MMSGNTPYLSSHSWYFIWLLEQFTNSSKLKYIWMEKTLASVSENVWLLNSDTKMIKQGGEGQYGNTSFHAPWKHGGLFVFLHFLLSGTGGRDESFLDPPLD